MSWFHNTISRGLQEVHALINKMPTKLRPCLNFYVIKFCDLQTYHSGCPWRVWHGTSNACAAVDQRCEAVGPLDLQVRSQPAEREWICVLDTGLWRKNQSFKPRASRCLSGQASIWVQRNPRRFAKAKKTRRTPLWMSALFLWCLFYVSATDWSVSQSCVL